ncbi:Ribosomal protein S5/S7, eukaryotic/archaeal [Pelomyxa schiedti]|nr:Ribosomal protein S5/S7, eukaryotic/archaeal [Pelomyxa schiedti]
MKGSLSRTAPHTLRPGIFPFSILKTVASPSSFFFPYLRRSRTMATTPEPKLFHKWTYGDVVVNDISLVDYIALKQKDKFAQYLPHTAGRYNVKRFRKAQCPIAERLVNALIYNVKRFRKAQCPIAERLVNALMFHGRNNGKKLLAVRVVKHAFEVIHLMTDKNPLQILVDAIINSCPREDSTRVGTAGVVKRQAVDVSPLRRVNQSLYLLTTGARNASFRNIKTLSECLADEIMNAAKGSSNSFAIKKKDEIERVAKSNR